MRYGKVSLDTTKMTEDDSIPNVLVCGGPYSIGCRNFAPNEFEKIIKAMKAAVKAKKGKKK